MDHDSLLCANATTAAACANDASDQRALRLSAAFEPHW